MSARKIAKLEQMARNKVGDGKSPNLFFVGVGGGIVAVTRKLAEAKAMAHALAGHVTVEDRKTGLLYDSQEGAHWEPVFRKRGK